MNIKLEFISTKEPKWHIFYKKQPKSNEGDVIVYKCGENEQAFSDEIAGCTSNMGNINQYLTFFGKVMYNLTTQPHLLPFKDNNISTESIMDKIISKVEDVVQRAVNNNCNFNGICGICPQNCHLSKNNCSNDGYIKAIYNKFNISYLQNNDTSIPNNNESATPVILSDSEESQIDTFKLEAEHQTATALVEANMAQFEAERHEQREKEQADRETLIAEASRLTGRVEAFGFMSKVAHGASLTTLKEIKESGVYKQISGVKSWEDYCLSIGYSRRYIDEQLENLSTLGDSLLELTSTFKLGTKDLRQLRKQVKTGNLEVKEESVVIDGEVIPLDDKDELRDALDTLLKSKYKEIEEKDKLLKEKEIQLSVVRETKDGFARRMDRAEEEAAEYKKEIEKLKNNKPSFKNVSEADSEDFNKLLTLESDWRDLFNSLKNATNDDNLSSFNKSMLGGIVAQILVMLDDFRMQLNGKSEFYFHGVNIDEEYLNNQISPSDYLAMQNEK